MAQQDRLPPSVTTLDALIALLRRRAGGFSNRLAKRRQSRPQRPLPLRQREKIQEVPWGVGQDRCARLSPPRQFDRSNLTAAWHRNSFRSMQCMNGTSNIDATSPSASRSRSIERVPNCRQGRENGAAILSEVRKKMDRLSPHPFQPSRRGKGKRIGSQLFGTCGVRASKKVACQATAVKKR
jgi:hypothetical protein